MFEEIQFGFFEDRVEVIKNFVMYLDKWLDIYQEYKNNIFLIGVQLFVQVYGEVFDCFGFVFGGIELSFFRYGYDFV